MLNLFLLFHESSPFSLHDAYSKMEIVGENTLSYQKVHHGCSGKKNDYRMVDSWKSKGKFGVYLQRIVKDRVVDSKTVVNSENPNNWYVENGD